MNHIYLTNPVQFKDSLFNHFFDSHVKDSDYFLLDFYDISCQVKQLLQAFNPSFKCVGCGTPNEGTYTLLLKNNFCIIAVKEHEEQLFEVTYRPVKGKEIQCKKYIQSNGLLIRDLFKTHFETYVKAGINSNGLTFYYQEKAKSLLQKSTKKNN